MCCLKVGRGVEVLGTTHLAKEKKEVKGRELWRLCALPDGLGYEVSRQE